MMRNLILSALLITGCATAPPVSKPPVDQSLYDEIARVDKQMFDAFNAHDADKLQTFFSEDLEFYHDKGGLQSFAQAMAPMRENFARNNGLRRDLVPGTLEVYPIKGYGAVEIGNHRFCHVENGKDDCGVFKFIHVWRYKDNTWKITRVISYDH